MAVAELPQLVEVAPDAIRTLSPLTYLGDAPPSEPTTFHLRAGDQPYRSISHADHMARFRAALEDAGWPVTGEIIAGRSHPDVVESPGIPAMDDLIVAVATDPGG